MNWHFRIGIMHTILPVGLFLTPIRAFWRRHVVDGSRLRLQRMHNTYTTELIIVIDHDSKSMPILSYASSLCAPPVFLLVLPPANWFISG